MAQFVRTLREMVVDLAIALRQLVQQAAGFGKVLDHFGLIGFFVLHHLLQLERDIAVSPCSARRAPTQ